MPNIYLEKIALTKEDTRSARVGGLKAGRKVEGKGAAVGAGVGGAVGAYGGTRWANTYLKSGPAAHQATRAMGLTPKKLKVGMGAIVGAVGALHGAALGEAVVHESADKARYKTHTKKINEGLSKSAAVTEKQVRAREDRNEGLAQLGATGGMVAGGAAGLGYVAGSGIHKGLKETGGYTAIKNSLKNAYQRKKTEKSLGKGVTLMGKGKAVALSTGSRESIARGTGNAMGKALSRKGLLGGALGAAVGSNMAYNAVRKRTDASDVDHYKKLSKKNG